MDLTELRSKSFDRILLIKLSALGDVVHTIPVLHKLRERYPNARIDWLIKRSNAELVGSQPALSNVIVFPHDELLAPLRRGSQAVKRTLRLVRELRANKYELVVDMHGQVRTAGATLMTGAPVRIGFGRPRAAVRKASTRNLPAHVYRHAWTGAREGSWLAYTHTIPLETLDMHAVDRYLRLGLLLGFEPFPPDFSLSLPASALAAADAMLGQHGIEPHGPSSRFVALAPGATWPTKEWSATGFAEVARHFVQRGTKVVLFGASIDAMACATVADQVPGVVNLCGKTTVTEFAALLSRAALAITNDSGPMHLAVALDRPTVSIFGPTDSIWIGPYGRPEAVISAGLPCAPCYLRKLSRCAYGHACMTQVSPGAVIDRGERILGKSSTPAEPALVRAGWM